MAWPITFKGRFSNTSSEAIEILGISLCNWERSSPSPSAARIEKRPHSNDKKRPPVATVCSSRHLGGVSVSRTTTLKVLSSWARSTSSMSPNKKVFSVDAFCLRQFDASKKPTGYIDIDPSEFEAIINHIYAEGKAHLVDGYAPFCKHLFIPNTFTNVKLMDAEITEENERHLKTTYEARTEKELPVLTRYFPLETFSPEKAPYLDVICYSREQIVKENEAMGVEPDKALNDIPWGIISVKGQSIDKEIPMQPITMMRNALGKEEGGSGVRLDRQKYQESVDYWAKHAIVK